MSKWIDRLTRTLSLLATWCVLLAASVSALNAFVRYGLDWSSNAFLEIQWYFFAVTVMLGAPWVLQLNEHVRVDLLYGKLKAQWQVWIDLLGLIFFLLPVMAFVGWLSWPLFWNAWTSGEMSPNAGGLLRWPVVFLMPLGFGLLSLQGLSEVIKRVAHIRGLIELDLHYEKPVQ
jgi:TRAP-type mannitol/chloroaromatic compound transport system permease small subunit